MKLRRIITPNRFRKFITTRKAKWAALAVCLLLAAVFVSSRWMFIRVQTWSTTALEWHVRVEQGRIAVARLQLSGEGLPQRRTVVGYGRVADPNLDLWLDWSHQKAGFGVDVRYVRLPLWMPLLLLAIWAAWLWRSDRRIQPWQCAQCRYDLRGLEEGGENGVCPECGLAKSEA